MLSRDAYTVHGRDITDCHIEVPSVELEVSALSRPAQLKTVTGPIKLVLTPQNLTHVPKIRCLLELYLQHKKPVGESELPDTEMQGKHETEDESLPQDHNSQSELTTSSTVVVDSSSTTLPADDLTTPESTADAAQITSQAPNNKISIRHEDTLRRSLANTSINEERHGGPSVAPKDLNDQQPPAYELYTTYSVLASLNGSTTFTNAKLYFLPAYPTLVWNGEDIWSMHYKDINVGVESLTLQVHGVVSSRDQNNMHIHSEGMSWEIRVSVKTTTSEATQSITDSFYRHGASVEVAGLVSSSVKPRSPPNEDETAVSAPASVGHIPGPTSVLSSTLDANLEIDDVPMGDVKVRFDEKYRSLTEYYGGRKLGSVWLKGPYSSWRLSWPHIHLFADLWLPCSSTNFESPIHLAIVLQPEDDAKAEAVRHYFETCVPNQTERAKEIRETPEHILEQSRKLERSIRRSIALERQLYELDPTLSPKTFQPLNTYEKVLQVDQPLSEGEWNKLLPLLIDELSENPSTPFKRIRIATSLQSSFDYSDAKRFSQWMQNLRSNAERQRSRSASKMGS
jgi:hypothetical protein